MSLEKQHRIESIPRLSLIPDQRATTQPSFQDELGLFRETLEWMDPNQFNSMESLEDINIPGNPQFVNAPGGLKEIMEFVEPESDGGEYPVVKPDEMHCTTARQFLDSVALHAAETKHIVYCGNNPMERTLGFHCEDCNKSWWLRLFTTPGEALPGVEHITVSEKISLNTEANRQQLAFLWSGGRSSVFSGKETESDEEDDDDGCG